jgi:hypothetical protein
MTVDIVEFGNMTVDIVEFSNEAVDIVVFGNMMVNIMEIRNMTVVIVEFSNMAVDIVEFGNVKFDEKTSHPFDPEVAFPFSAFHFPPKVLRLEKAPQIDAESQVSDFQNVEKCGQRRHCLTLSTTGDWW